LADHTEAVSPWLYRGCMARQVRITMLHNASQFLIPFLAPFYTNTAGELNLRGHTHTHTILTTPDILPSVPSESCNGPISRVEASNGVPITRLPPHKTDWNRTK